MSTALLFGAATSDRVDCGSAAALDFMQQVTAIVIARVDTLTDTRVFISKYRGASAAGWELALSGTAGAISGRYARGAGTDLLHVSADGLVSPGVWTVVAMVANRLTDEMRLLSAPLGMPLREPPYASRSAGSGAYNSDASFNVYVGGRHAATPNGALQGAISAAAVYNRILTTLEINQVAKALSHPSRAHRANAVPGAQIIVSLGLTGTGTQVDVSGNGNHGTVTGASLTYGDATKHALVSAPIWRVLTSVPDVPEAEGTFVEGFGLGFGFGLPIVHASAGGGGGTPSTFDVTLAPLTLYQVLDADPWEATSQSAQPGQVNRSGVTDTSAISPDWDTYKDYLYDQAVNDLNVTALRIECRTDSTGAVLQQAAMDYKLAEVVPLHKAAVEAAGKTWRFHLCHVNHADSTLETSPSNFAAVLLAEWQRLEALDPDYVPYDFECLEPDQTFPMGGASNFANCLDALGDALEGAGYTARFRVPSVVSLNNAVNWINTAKAVPGLASRITHYTYHLYSGMDDADGDIPINNVGNLAQADGKGAAQLEWIGATYTHLHRDLTLGRGTRWQQYTLAFRHLDGAGAVVTPDNGGKLYLIKENQSTPETIIELGSRTKFLRQYFRYLVGGSQRIGLTSSSSNFVGTAWIKPNGKYVVVLNAAAAGTCTVGPLPAGTYGRTYTTAAAFDQDNGDQTIGAGAGVDVSIPAAGVFTVEQQ